MRTFIALPYSITAIQNLKAGETIKIVAAKGVDGSRTNDFGLYGNGRTNTTEDGVTISADDYEIHRVFTFGPEAVAHLFTHKNEAYITAAGEALGDFFVVLKPNRGNYPIIFAGQKKLA